MRTSGMVLGEERAERVRVEVRRLGRRVRELRRDAGLSQAEVAERAGINRAVLSQIENGSYELGSGKLAMLASALGVETSEFFPIPGETLRAQ